MLASAFHIRHLVAWVVAFAILGGLPKVVFLFFRRNGTPTRCPSPAAGSR